MTHRKALARFASPFALVTASMLFVSAMASADAINVPLPANDFRDTYSGDIIATGRWGSVGLELDWTISFDPTSSAFNDVGFMGAYSYSYVFRDGDSFATPDPEISHWILELSPSITANNYTDIIRDVMLFDPDNPTTTSSVVVEAPRTYSPSDPGNSNPGLPGDIYGLKFDTGTSADLYGYSFLSTRAPIWGDFYAKDGVIPTGGGDVYMYNSAFGTDPTGATTDFSGWIPVPDTTNGTPAPEPGTLLLLGAGLLALGLRRSRRR